MRVTRSISALIEAIISEDDVGKGFLLGIDGMDGAGKTNLATRVGKKLNASVIALDDFIEENKDAYVPILESEDVRSVRANADGPVIVEGVCLLAAIEKIGIPISRLVYVKKIDQYGVWDDEDECDPPENIEELLEKKRQELKAFRKVEAQLENAEMPKDEQVQLSGLRKEVIRYHAKYRPLGKADYVFERTDAPSD